MSDDSRNKTIKTSIEDGQEFLDRTISVEKNQNDLNNVLNKTILGDTFDVCSKLPNNSIDLMIVDPPYNLTKKFNKMTFHKEDDEDYKNYTRKWIEAIYPLLKNDGSIYVCCDWKSSLVIGNVLREFFDVRSRITWQREKGRGAKANWKNSLEDVWFCTKSDEYTFNLDAVKIRKKVIAPYKVDGVPKDWVEGKKGNFRDTCPSNFWDDITIPFWSMAENTAHPTQKSEKLIAKMILASSNENDVVFDPFLGSGTTSVVAKKLKRNYIGIEMDEQFCVWAEQRLDMANNDDSIQGFVNGVFWERNTVSEQS